MNILVRIRIEEILIIIKWSCRTLLLLAVSTLTRWSSNFSFNNFS